EAIPRAALATGPRVLHTIEAEDAAIYFGRDDETRAAIERLDGRRTQGRGTRSHGAWSHHFDRRQSSAVSRSSAAKYGAFGSLFNFVVFNTSYMCSASTMPMAWIASWRSSPSPIRRCAIRPAGVSSLSAIWASTMACRVACSFSFG